jgi:tetratricopeptide (TPR) repeat protein
MLTNATARTQPGIAGPSPDRATTSPNAASLLWWKQGQDALLEGKVEEAIRCFHNSLHNDPRCSRSMLSLAAAHLQQGDSSQALPWLGRYLTAEPNHHQVRLQYAEMLRRQGDLSSAMQQYETIVETVGDAGADANLLFAAQQNLLDLATEAGDRYREHLYRGVGVYRLAEARMDLPAGAGDDPSAESLLFRALAELERASALRPGSARPLWYLHLVWKRLNQRHPATRCLREADGAPVMDLGGAEKRALHQALLSENVDRNEQ